MLYEAVLLASHVYHQDPLGSEHDTFLRGSSSPLLDTLEDIDTVQAGRIIKFLNRWNTHFQPTPQELAEAIQCVVAELSLLRSETFLHLNLERQVNGHGRVGEIIARVFDTIAKAGWQRQFRPQYASTGASKILHLVNGQQEVSTGGQVKSPLVATKSPHIDGAIGSSSWVGLL